MESREIPVLLLTGYLGSGKTTLVNKILNNRRGIKFAVIVNDIGEVNIDSDLIEKGGVVGKKDESLVALQNGCICCTLKMDLVEQLRDITAMRKFDYIVIEASGICEPEPIAQTICSIPVAYPEFTRDGHARLDCIVTVVDALRMRDEFGSGSALVGKHIEEDDIENLVIQQIEFCNIILLNKASEIPEEDLASIRRIIRTLQPEAEIIECDYCDVDFAKLLDTGLFDFEKTATSATWIKEVEGLHDEEDDDDDDDDDDEDGHHHHHHHHDEDEGEAEEYGIGSFVYYRRQPLDINRFDYFVAKKWPTSVIRAKGVCYFTDEYDKCYLFEQAGRQISLKDAGLWYGSMPEDELIRALAAHPELARDWDRMYGDRMQKIVFIGRHMDKAAIEKELDDCLLW